MAKFEVSLIYSSFFHGCPLDLRASLVAQMVKNPPAMQETLVWSWHREDPLEKEMATHSSLLAWEIPWTEEPGGLQSMGSQRGGHDWATFTRTGRTQKLFNWYPLTMITTGNGETLTLFYGGAWGDGARGTNGTGISNLDRKWNGPELGSEERGKIRNRVCEFNNSYLCVSIYCTLGTVNKLYFFALVMEEGFLISPCYSLELCIQMLISFLFSFAFHFSSFIAVCKDSSDNHFAFLKFFPWGWSWSLPPVQCHEPPSIVLQALFQI